jgi:serine/threonine-protein kinase
VNPDVPEPISDVCMKALAPNPEQRFQTAIEMVDALEDAARAAGIGLAKPREVGAFLAELKLPQPSADGGKLPSSSSSINVGSRSQPSSATAVPMVASTPAPAARRGRSPLIALGAVAVVLAAIAVFLAFRVGARADDVTAPATQAAAQPPEQKLVEPTATPSTAEPAPSESAEPALVASAAPEPSAKPGPSAEGTPVAPPKAVRGAPAKRPVPGTPSSKGSAPKGGTGYRPDEL